MQVVGAEPVEGHTLQGLKCMTESAVPALYDPCLLDDRVMVADQPAFETARACSFCPTAATDT